MLEPYSWTPKPTSPGKSPGLVRIDPGSVPGHVGPVSQTREQNQSYNGVSNTRSWTSSVRTFALIRHP